MKTRTLGYRILEYEYDDISINLNLDLQKNVFPKIYHYKPVIEYVTELTNSSKSALGGL